MAFLGGLKGVFRVLKAKIGPFVDPPPINQNLHLLRPNRPILAYKPYKGLYRPYIGLIKALLGPLWYLNNTS